MNDDSVLAAPSCEQTTGKTPTTKELNTKWNNVIRRRAFLKGLGTAGAITALLSGGALLASGSKAYAQDSASRLSKGDAAILRLLAAVELIEADLWVQYNELGGANGGNPSYIAALQNLDSDMPQYISDNTDDELSHAAFLNAYLKSKGSGTSRSGRIPNSSKQQGHRSKTNRTSH